jgi:DNA polymerase III subunit delta'
MTAPWIAAQAKKLLTQRGHAWLLQGPSGLGQYSLSMTLARTWLCDDPTGAGACGRCASCHAFDVRAHTDLTVLMPETFMVELGWPLSEKAQTDIDEKKRKASREIRVEAMRDAVEFAQRTSGRGRGKVILVYPAERMNTVTANTLLKTLEEPAGDMKFVLASEAAHMLLPTIRSRCLLHTMAWPGESEALAWLAEQGVGPEAAALLRAAGGRPDDALAFARSGRDPATWSRLPKALAKGEPAVLEGWTPAEAVSALQKLCHDMIATTMGAAPRFFAAPDLPRNADVAALTSWARELAAMARTVEHPFNPGLMLEALVTRARSALNSSA